MHGIQNAGMQKNKGFFGILFCFVFCDVITSVICISCQRSQYFTQLLSEKMSSVKRVLWINHYHREMKWKFKVRRTKFEFGIWNDSLMLLIWSIEVMTLQIFFAFQRFEYHIHCISGVWWKIFTAQVWWKSVHGARDMAAWIPNTPHWNQCKLAWFQTDMNQTNLHCIQWG